MVWCSINFGMQYEVEEDQVFPIYFYSQIWFKDFELAFQILSILLMNWSFCSFCYVPVQHFVGVMGCLQHKEWIDFEPFRLQKELSEPIELDVWNLYVSDEKDLEHGMKERERERERERNQKRIVNCQNLSANWMQIDLILVNLEKLVYFGT